jgi:hypothetical protein
MKILQKAELIESLGLVGEGVSSPLHLKLQSNAEAVNR